MKVLNLQSSTAFSGLYIVFDGSTLNEKPGYYGISHLSEHLLAKAWDKYLDDFKRYHIQWNAFTSSRKVIFYFTGLEEYMSKFVDKCINDLLNYTFTEKQFNNEKKIVLEEYKDSVNGQTNSHFINLYRKLYNYNTPFGLRENIENISFENCNSFINNYLRDPLVIILVSKSKTLNGEPPDFSFNKNDILGDMLPGRVYELENKFKEKTSIINISPKITKDFAYMDIITHIIGSGLSSPLYQEVREKRGLCYYIHFYLHSVTNVSANIIIQTEVSNEKANELQEVVNEVLNNPEKYITQERFDITKEAFQIEYKIQEINRFQHIAKYITPSSFNTENVIDDLTLDKILEVYDEHFKDFYKSTDKTESWN